MTLSSLTKAQIEAIDHFKGPLLIVAGPGAGKTWVLVERVLSLIEKRGVNPHNILLTTFTVKAAEELKARISKRIGIKAQAIQISTVHSFCKMILEKYSDYHDYGTSVNVLSDDAKLMFLRSKYKEIGLSGHGLHNLIDFYNKCNENRIDPDELINEIKKRYPDKERYIKTCISYKKYLKLLKDNNKADFSILQENALKLLEENPEVLEDVREQFQFILVDEYQDTNPLQDKLFELISRPKCNICVVGDDDQSIYSFRGANIRNFIRFPKRYENTKIIKLDKNFRSTINIINASEDFIAKNRYLPKEINPWREEGNNVVLLENDDEDEAKNVVKLVKKMKEKGIIPHYGYVTLLFRSVKYQAGGIVAELKENDIPFEVIGDASFLKRDEIRTMLYLLSYVDPPDYDGKFKVKWRDWWKISMFENEFLNLTEDTKMFLRELEKTADLSELLEPADFKKIGIGDELDIIKLSKLNQLKNELHENRKSLLMIFYDIIEISGYLKWLLEKGSPKSDEKLFNLAKLSSIINQYEDLTEDPSIEDFLRYFYKLPKKMYYDEVIYEDPHSLKIMTVHKAKGLEFPVVIICSVVKDKFPMKSWKDRDPVPIPEHLLIYGNEDTTDEERRLFYVAMTRAQDNLIISTSKDKDTNKNLSFIDEIGIKKFSDISALIENCKDREMISNPINISYSAINAYSNCPFMYKLVYFYFLEYKPTNMQNYGTILHNCLNRIHLAIKNNETINEDIITGIVEKCWIDLYKTEKEENAEKKKLKLKLIKYYSSMHDHIKEVISTEEQFSIYSNGMLISGRTDLIIKNKDDKFELIDFKARGESGIEKTHVETQLRVYEYALQDKYKFDKLCAYKFQDNQKTYFEPNGKDQKISQEIEEICKKIENENYEPIKTSLCSQCFFKFCCG